MISKETFYDDYFSKVWCDWKDSKPWFHMEMRNVWNISTYKESLKRMHAIKKHLENRGQFAAFVCIQDGDSKLEKFMELHGFTRFAVIDGNVYMIQEF